MIEIYLLIIIAFYVLSFTVSRHQVHVQQSGATVQIEFSAGNTVDAYICSIRVGISRRGDAQQHVLQTYLAFQHIQQMSDALV